MLIIRFSRQGKKKEPIYRIIISEKTKDTQGKYLEVLGHYNPCSKAIKLEKERIKYWLSKGAQLSSAINNLLINNKVIEGKKRKKGHRVKIKEGEALSASAEKAPAEAKKEETASPAPKPEEKKEEAGKKTEKPAAEKAEPEKEPAK